MATLDVPQLAAVLRGCTRVVLRRDTNGRETAVAWAGPVSAPEVAYAEETPSGWRIFFATLGIEVAGEHAQTLLPMSVEDTPQFKHDCDDCIFLGRSEVVLVVPVTATRKRYIQCDQYYCTVRTSLAPATLIQRFGNEGPDYSSCPVSEVPGLLNNSDVVFPWQEIFQRYTSAQARLRQ